MLRIQYILHFFFFLIVIYEFGEGNGNPLQYSCLENSVGRGAWWVVVHRVAQSWTWLKRLSMHARIGEGNGNPLQYSCLENPMDSRAWWAEVFGVAQSWTQLTWLSSSSCCILWRGVWNGGCGGLGDGPLGFQDFVRVSSMITLGLHN